MADEAPVVDVADCSDRVQLGYGVGGQGQGRAGTIPGRAVRCTIAPEPRGCMCRAATWQVTRPRLALTASPSDFTRDR